MQIFVTVIRFSDSEDAFSVMTKLCFFTKNIDYLNEFCCNCLFFCLIKTLKIKEKFYHQHVRWCCVSFKKVNLMLVSFLRCVLKKQPTEVFYKEAILKIFAIFTGK